MQPGTAVTSQQCRDDGHGAHSHTVEMESSIKQGTAATLHSRIAKEAYIHTLHMQNSRMFSME